MSRITDNLLVKGARGNVGKQFVYKKRGENTHIARMPQVNKNASPTEQQLKVRDKFSEAALYAQGAVASPELKTEYEKKASPGKTAHNMAFRDYLKAPVVKGIDAGNYTGLAGSPIVVTAKDDFRVIEVEVSIHSSTGELVEKGKAFLNPINRNKWTYTTVQALPSLAGSSISSIAKDIPGNEGKLAITL